MQFVWMSWGFVWVPWSLQSSICSRRLTCMLWRWMQCTVSVLTHFLMSGLRPCLHQFSVLLNYLGRFLTRDSPRSISHGYDLVWACLLTRNMYVVNYSICIARQVTRLSTLCNIKRQRDHIVSGSWTFWGFDQFGQITRVSMQINSRLRLSAARCCDGLGKVPQFNKKAIDTAIESQNGSVLIDRICQPVWGSDEV
jgi:hypothetical protein